MREALYSKLKKVAELIFTFLTTPEVKKCVELIAKMPKAKIMMHSSFSDNCLHHYDIKFFNLFDSELQMINIKLVIKNKLKDLSDELKKFKFQSILVKKINDQKPVHFLVRC